MTFSKIFRLELLRLFKSFGFWIALVYFSTINVSYFLNEVGKYTGNDKIYMPSAAGTFSLGWFNSGLLLVGVAALICALPFLGSYISDIRSKILPITFTKTKKSYYYASKLLIAFLGTFIVMLLPLILNQLLCFCFFDVFGNGICIYYCKCNISKYGIFFGEKSRKFRNKLQAELNFKFNSIVAYFSSTDMAYSTKYESYSI